MASLAEKNFIFEELLEKALSSIKTELSVLKNQNSKLLEKMKDHEKKFEILEHENDKLRKELNDLKEEQSIVKRRDEKLPDKNDEPSDDKIDTISSFESLSDDLLHNILEFVGNSYSKFGLINKQCNKIYDVKAYKLTKETFLHGYAPLREIIQQILQDMRERNGRERCPVSIAIVRYNRNDLLKWTIKLQDKKLLAMICRYAIPLQKLDVLIEIFCNSNLKTLRYLRERSNLVYLAAFFGEIETIKCLRSHGCIWDEFTIQNAQRLGRCHVVEWLRKEGCPEYESESESESVDDFGSEDEDDEDESEDEGED